MGIFDKLFGGVLKGFDVEEVLKKVITHSTAGAAKKPFVDLFLKMKVEGRANLATVLESAAKHLRSGECAKAGEDVAHLIDSIKF